MYISYTTGVDGRPAPADAEEVADAIGIVEVVEAVVGAIGAVEVVGVIALDLAIAGAETIEIVTVTVTVIVTVIEMTKKRAREAKRGSGIRNKWLRSLLCRAVFLWY